jgi:hypothetical protein
MRRYNRYAQVAFCSAVRGQLFQTWFEVHVHKMKRGYFLKKMPIYLL